MRKIIIALLTIFAASVSAQELTEISTLSVNTTYGLSMDAEDNMVYFGVQFGWEGGPWSLQVYDYSDPYSPYMIGETVGAAMHMHVEGSYVYRTYTHFTKVVDVSDPSNPTNRGGIDPHPGYHNGRAITAKDHWVFVAVAYGEWSPVYSILVIDASNPDAPFIETTIARDNYIRSMMVVGDVLYVAGIHLKTYDISDPTNPVLLGTYPSDWIAGESLWTDGTYAYFCHSDPEFGSPALDVVDVSDPANMFMVGQLDNYWGLENDGDPLHGYLFSARGDWLNVLDISDPTDPHLVYSVDPSYPGENGVEYTGFISHINYVPTGPEGGIVYAQSWKHIKAFSFITTGARDSGNELAPRFLKLSQNYPNPFNAFTTISYTLTHSSSIKLEIYDILGRHVETLLDYVQEEGKHQVNWYAQNAPSGVYFYTLQAGDYIKTKRMLLLK